MNHRPRKRFGQHFLRDVAVIEAIATAIAPKAADVLVEIGPGEGVLTAALLDRVPDLHAVEIDRDLAARLRKRFGDRLDLLEGDALGVDFAQWPQTDLSPRRLRMVGNLPYNISTPLLFHLDTFASVISDQHFMLQKEVVDRMAAQPGTAEYGRLSVTLQAGWAVVPLFDVPPEAFDPPPQVDSTVVRMQPLPQQRAAIADPALFEQVVAAGFGQRRKMLRNPLAAYYVRDPDALAAIISPQARAGDIAPAQWVAFSKRLAAIEAGHA